MGNVSPLRTQSNEGMADLRLADKRAMLSEAACMRKRGRR